jgi:hypothetical protein
VAAVLAGCGDDLKKSLDDQNVAIIRYLDGRSLTYTIHNGVYRYIANADRDGYDAQTVAETGDEVWFDFEARLFSSTSGAGALFYTNKPELIGELEGAETLSWPVTVQKVRLGVDPLLGGVADAMPGCRTGDSLALFIPSNRAYGDRPMGVVPQNTTVVYVLNIRNVVKQ